MNGSPIVVQTGDGFPVKSYDATKPPVNRNHIPSTLNPTSPPPTARPGSTCTTDVIHPISASSSSTDSSSQRRRRVFHLKRGSIVENRARRRSSSPPPLIPPQSIPVRSKKTISREWSARPPFDLYRQPDGKSLAKETFSRHDDKALQKRLPGRLQRQPLVERGGDSDAFNATRSTNNNNNADASASSVLGAESFNQDNDEVELSPPPKNACKSRREPLIHTSLARLVMELL